MIAPDPIPHQTDAASFIAKFPGTKAKHITVVLLDSRTHGSNLISNDSLVSSDKPLISAAFCFTNKQTAEKLKQPLCRMPANISYTQTTPLTLTNWVTNTNKHCHKNFSIGVNFREISC